MLRRPRASPLLSRSPGVPHRGRASGQHGGHLRALWLARHQGQPEGGLLPRELLTSRDQMPERHPGPHLPGPLKLVTHLGLEPWSSLGFVHPGVGCKPPSQSQATCPASRSGMYHCTDGHQSLSSVRWSQPSDQSRVKGYADLSQTRVPSDRHFQTARAVSMDVNTGKHTETAGT